MKEKQSKLDSISHSHLIKAEVTENPIKRRMTNALRSKRFQMINSDSSKPPMLQNYILSKLQKETAKLQSMGIEDKLARGPNVRERRPIVREKRPVVSERRPVVSDRRPNFRDRSMNDDYQDYYQDDNQNDYQDDYDYKPIYKKRRRRPVGETRGEYGSEYGLNGRRIKTVNKRPRKEFEDTGTKILVK